MYIYNHILWIYRISFLSLSIIIHFYFFYVFHLVFVLAFLFCSSVCLLLLLLVVYFLFAVFLCYHQPVKIYLAALIHRTHYLSNHPRRSTDLIEPTMKAPTGVHSQSFVQCLQVSRRR